MDLFTCRWNCHPLSRNERRHANTCLSERIHLNVLTSHNILPKVWDVRHNHTNLRWPYNPHCCLRASRQTLLVTLTPGKSFTKLYTGWKHCYTRNQYGVVIASACVRGKAACSLSMSPSVQLCLPEVNNKQENFIYHLHKNATVILHIRNIMLFNLCLLLNPAAFLILFCWTSHCHHCIENKATAATEATAYFHLGQ